MSDARTPQSDPVSPRPSPRSRTPCCPAGRRPGSSRRSTGSGRSPSCSATRSAPTRSIHLTGTNGKTSTSRMIDTLLRALDLRTGRFTSPHLERMNERICVDGEPLTDEEFVRAFNDVAPYTHLVDAAQPHPLSFFETIVGMAYAAFADAPVDVAVVEVGMGGVVGRHQRRRRRGRRGDRRSPSTTRTYLGDTPEEIAVEKAGIIKPGADGGAGRAAARAGRGRCCAACAEVGATPVREGLEFGVVSRVPAVGGQVLRCRGCGRATTTCSCRSTARTRRRTPPSRWPRSRRSSATRPLDDDAGARRRSPRSTSPGRLEIIRRSPTILLDAAHNPHGAEAVAAALEDSFAFSPLIGVIGVMADKDVEGRAGRVRAAPRARRLHAELHRARDARRRARGDRARGVRRRPRLGHAAIASACVRPRRSRSPRPARAAATRCGRDAREAVARDRDELAWRARRACARRRAPRGRRAAPRRRGAGARRTSGFAVSAIAAARAVGVVEQAAHHRRERLDHRRSSRSRSRAPR